MLEEVASGLPLIPSTKCALTDCCYTNNIIVKIDSPLCAQQYCICSSSDKQNRRKKADNISGVHDVMLISISIFLSLSP